MTRSENTRRTDVFQDVGVVDFIFGRYAELLERDVDVQQHLAAGVCFADLHEDVEVMVLGTGHPERGFGGTDQRRLSCECMGEGDFFRVGVVLLGGRVAEE